MTERRKEIRQEVERQHREEAARLKAAEDERKKREQRRIMLQKQETINRLNTEEREKRGQRRQPTDEFDEPVEGKPSNKKKKDENCAC